MAMSCEHVTWRDAMKIGRLDYQNYQRPNEMQKKTKTTAGM